MAKLLSVSAKKEWNLSRPLFDQACKAESSIDLSTMHLAILKVMKKLSVGGS